MTHGHRGHRARWSRTATDQAPALPPRARYSRTSSSECSSTLPQSGPTTRHHSRAARAPRVAAHPAAVCLRTAPAPIPVNFRRRRRQWCHHGRSPCPYLFACTARRTRTR
ncbi:unnamed protein product [Ectocarpus sp. 12 AP-2014]